MREAMRGLLAGARERTHKQQEHTYELLLLAAHNPETLEQYADWIDLLARVKEDIDREEQSRRELDELVALLRRYGAAPDEGSLARSGADEACRWRLGPNTAGTPPLGAADGVAVSRLGVRGVAGAGIGVRAAEPGSKTYGPHSGPPGAETGSPSRSRCAAVWLSSR